MFAAVALAVASGVVFLLAAFGVTTDVDLPLLAFGLWAFAFAASWLLSAGWPARNRG